MKSVLFLVEHLPSSHFHPCHFYLLCTLSFCFTPICWFTLSLRPICPVVFCWIRFMSCTFFLLQSNVEGWDSQNTVWPLWLFLSTCSSFGTNLFASPVFCKLTYLSVYFLLVAVNIQSSRCGCFCEHAPTFCLLHNVFHRPLSSRFAFCAAFKHIKERNSHCEKGRQASKAKVVSKRGHELNSHRRNFLGWKFLKM